MQLQKLWQQSQFWLLTLWILAALVVKPGWPVFAAGCFIWVTVLYLTARSVFWYWSYTLNFNPFKTDANLQKSIACGPLLPQPYLTAAVLYAKKKQWRQAIPLLEKAAQLNSKKYLTQIKSVLAVAYRETDELNKAAAILRELETAGVKNAHLYTNFAAVHLKRGESEEAIAAAAKARSFDVNAAEPVLIIAKAHFLMGEYQAALDDYQWALSRLSWPVETFYWLGRAELALQLTEAAREHLQKAVARIGDDPQLSDVTLEEAQSWLAKTVNSDQ